MDTPRPTINHIRAGDVNITANTAEDRKRGTISPKQPKHKADQHNRTTLLQEFMDQTKRIDIWRHHHPIEREYSYYSHPHDSFACIDYFLTTYDTLTLTDTSDIKEIAILDHAPITLIMRSPTTQIGGRTWKFPSNLQGYPDFNKHLNYSWTFYLFRA